MRKFIKKTGKIMCLFMTTALLTACGDAKKTEEKSEGEKNVIVVDADAKEKEGKSYKTMAGAFEYLNENPPASEKERMTIKVAEGTYREYLELTAPYVTLKGTGDVEKTILTFYYGASCKYNSQEEEMSTGTSSSVTIAEGAHDFIAENITFENSYNLYVPEEEKEDYDASNEIALADKEKEPWNDDYEKQAVALQVSADRSEFINCRMIARQDTLFVNTQARCYFNECFIEGTADFIFGDATAVFENCTLNCPYDSGYVTASQCSENNPFGYMFKDCSITNVMPEGVEAKASKEEDYALGRPWRANPQVIFWNCKMDKHIGLQKRRYVSMGDYRPKNCRYIECGTMDIEGNLINLDEVLQDYVIRLTDEELKANYSVEKHFEARFDTTTQTLMEADYWKPTTMKTE